MSIILHSIDFFHLIGRQYDYIMETYDWIVQTTYHCCNLGKWGDCCALQYYYIMENSLHYFGFFVVDTMLSGQALFYIPVLVIQRHIKWSDHLVQLLKINIVSQIVGDKIGWRRIVKRINHFTVNTQQIKCLWKYCHMNVGRSPMTLKGNDKSNR